MRIRLDAVRVYTSKVRTIALLFAVEKFHESFDLFIRILREVDFLRATC